MCTRAGPTRLVRPWTTWALTGLATVLGLRACVVQPFAVSASSMEPTLLAGDFVGVNRMAGTMARSGSRRAVDRGEVWIVAPFGRDRALVKRIVALPLDTVQMRDGRLFVNGKAEGDAQAPTPTAMGRDQLLASHRWQLRYLLPSVDTLDYRPTRHNWGPLVLPPEYYFALGDNRDHSKDSRHWGFVHLSNLLGRVAFTYYSFGRSTSFEKRVRWERIGRRVR